MHLDRPRVAEAEGYNPMLSKLGDATVQGKCGMKMDALYYID
jgi:hypothetical protein